jgi:Sulfatase-modifying factor enzyme 1
VAIVTGGCWEPNNPGLEPDAGEDAAWEVDAAVDAASDARPDVSLIDGTLGDAGSDATPGDAGSDAGTADASLDASVGSDAHCPDGGTNPTTCPPDMVLLSGTYCIDIWEASRSDATALYPGVDDSFAVSAPDRFPWWSSVLTPGEADLACQGACKRLCTADEWQTACQGPTQTVYGYGDLYEPATCNGIDTRCNCSHATCAAEPTCPYAFCWSQCGGMFHVDPTGYSPGCVNGFGLYDMNGNVWEVVVAPDQYPYRGGAFNCGNSQTNHRCDFVPTWNISAKGFRCCRDPL